MYVWEHMDVVGKKTDTHDFFFQFVLQYLNKTLSGVLSVAMMAAVNPCKVQLSLAR